MCRSVGRSRSAPSRESVPEWRHFADRAILTLSAECIDTRFSGRAVTALRRAQERGQLRADVDPEAVVDQLWGACYHRLLLPDQLLTDEFADALVANLFDGVR